MWSEDRASVFELIWVIVDSGAGSKVLRNAKRNGIKGGTIFLGKGTASDRISSFLGISDAGKEIVLLGSDGATADLVLDALNKEFHLAKPNHGIAFTTSVCSISGTKRYRCEAIDGGRVADEAVYQIITTIVDKGKAGQVVDAAKRAGSRGGTVIHARGSGIHETSRLFAMPIEPEKEIVIILASSGKAGQIVTSIRQELRMDTPGNGIIFTQNVNTAYGLIE